ncbi:MAG: CIA30 family protein [Elainellaceae cyanobacterium]
MSSSSAESSSTTPKKEASGSWDLCRFAKTLAYFGVIPVLSGFDWFQSMLDSSPNPRADQGAIAYGATSLGDTLPTVDAPSHAPTHISTEPVTSTHPPNPTRLIFDFRESDTSIQEIWGAVDDVVMGGVSQSNMVSADNSALFTGSVSTANSGGFASVRTRNFDPPLDLSDYSGIELRLKGDGNRYKFILRDESRWDGVGYSTSFDTVADTWITVHIPFAELVPVFRARTVEDGQQISSGQVRAFQVMLSKFEYNGDLNPTFEPGEFKLFIETIQAYR